MPDLDASQYLEGLSSYESEALEYLSSIDSSLEDIETLLLDNQEYLVKVSDGVSYLVENPSTSVSEESVATLQQSLDVAADAAGVGTTVSLFLVACLAGGVVLAFLWWILRRFI